MNKILIIFFLAFSAFLASCGTKGDLYIPEKRYPQSETLNSHPDTHTSEYKIT